MTKKITLLIVVRLLLVTLFLSIGAFVFKIDRSFFYLIIAAVYFLTILYLVWLAKRRYLKALVITQIVFDCILETVVVFNTGSISSVFIILYCVTILSASIIVSPVIGMVTTGIASFLYVGQLWCAFFDLIPNVSISIINVDFSVMLYTAHVNIITFLLIGILAAFLARKLSQMEKTVQEKERTSLMGELAAQIAHEIRNPLTTISGSIELLEEELGDTIDAKNKNLMKAIVTESERVSGVFEQFLDFSKIDELDMSKIELQELLNEIFFLLENTGSLKTIEVIDKFSMNHFLLECDLNRIKQVFWNILRNALEAMPNGGTLTVETCEVGEGISIAFQDTGTGINAKMQKELFTPFRSSKKGGSGLGLVIAHKIIEKHFGRITVSSEAGTGTTFTVILPKKHIEE